MFSFSLRKCLNNEALAQIKLHKILGGNVYLSNKLHTKQPSLPAKDTQWDAIYHLPLIQLASAYNRVKKSYGLFTAVAIPTAYALEQASQLPPTSGMLVAAIGITSWLTLAISSLLFKNLVGFIYVNESNDKVKLAFVDYWGQRQDRIVNMNDLIPNWEQSKPVKFSFYQRILLHSDPKAKYKLLPRHGIIENSQIFVALFGE